MQKEALYYDKLKNSLVQCHLCPKNCMIKNGDYGNCNARKNIAGKLYSLVYENPCSVAIDPVEKKPLYHFLPDTKALSIGTFGCNLHCDFCQNHEISQNKPDENQDYIITAEDIIKKAKESNSKSIAYTYNEPTVFYEYALEISKKAKKQGLKNILISNGFINKEPLKEILKYIDAANIDLKSFDKEFYKKFCNGSLEPVLETIKTMRSSGMHIEITNLIIPELNDNLKTIDKMCKWIVKNICKDVPLHFSAFHPCYKMTEKQQTSFAILKKAKEIAEKNNISFVYIGNIQTDSSNTYCPKCKNLTIERNFLSVSKNILNHDKCPFCKTKIKGIWD